MFNIVSQLLFALFLSNPQVPAPAAAPADKPVHVSQQQKAKVWADSVMKTLSKDEKIAQLMIVRLSQIDPKTKKVVFFDANVTNLIKKYNIGGLCLFQGTAVEQAKRINAMQEIAKTPLMVCIDAEWGVGMRLTDDVAPLPKQMMLGAMRDSSVVYDYASLIARQCKRLGIQVNYAPVVDVNNNANNPVINDRSFGEDKYKVARYGIAYINGLQDNTVMATAKHFPGHGDVSVDSHYDLPVINKSMAELDSLELYPFRQVFKAGVSAVMVAHLYIPAIDATRNRATSLSLANIDTLMRKELGYQGLTFTDGLEMQGVQKYFPGGEASLQSLIAGNDMLCLPTDVPGTIAKVKLAIKKKQLSWADIDMHCHKVLMAKYMYGINKPRVISTVNIAEDLNAGIPEMKRRVAEEAITLVRNLDENILPLRESDKIAVVAVGTTKPNSFTDKLKADLGADIFFFDNNEASLLASLSGYKKVVLSLHGMSRSPAANFGISSKQSSFIQKVNDRQPAVLVVFGNAYALKNFCEGRNILLCYEDDPIIEETAAQMLAGELPFKGELPVSVCPQLPYGTGINTLHVALDLKKKPNYQVGKFATVDSIVEEALLNKATPGCVVMAVQNDTIIYQKAFGYADYAMEEKVKLTSIYDLASLTKVSATTLAIMKLKEEGRLQLDDNIGKYVDFLKGTNKEQLTIRQLLLHEGGLKSYFPFYKETIDDKGKPLPVFYQPKPDSIYNVPVSQYLYMRSSYLQNIYQTIATSPLGPAGKYVYSDNDYIILGKIVEAISGKSLDDYVRQQFYIPMGLYQITYLPLKQFNASDIIPTETDDYFRHSTLRGYVHDQGAAMLGGVAGHAGLFSNAFDLSAIMQMLLNGGTYNGKRYLQENTIREFTTYQSANSRRGLGFDKPEKDNQEKQDGYPSLYSSPLTFGHTGYTGTCIWADPVNKLSFIFLSNRVTPTVNSRLQNLKVREKLFDEFYKILAK